jgi:quinol monooxygenase YgiN
MINARCVAIQRNILSGVFLVALSLFAQPAFCQEVLRIVSFTAAGPAQHEILDNINPAKLYRSTEGCVSVKFWSNHSTGENGSVSLWKSQAELDKFLNSEAYKAIQGKVTYLIKGDVSVKTYLVYEPKQ